MSQPGLPGSKAIRRSADFSPCRTWRYTLVREWDDSLPRLLFVLLNPSTAGEHRDDPTNIRAIRFAMKWGYGSVVFVNLFAVRTPEPRVMMNAVDPVGPDNDRHIREQVERADLVVVAWGVHGTHRRRNKKVLADLADVNLCCLGRTKDGHPKHPLYLPKNSEPQAFIR